ncbi:G-protein coupled receptor GRL101-like [Acanthaster planci]|uniref:G-protein coupled receptor GRL101-like n=1 Tax=Acanthaster planci TaxID=133434 RepID=A0A8B7ZVK4_ACAPL|nr:G-protein coupled receptor GRL101-like [Acanthaster planci]
MLCDGKADCIQFGDDEDNCDIHGRPDGCESFMVKEILGVKCKQGWNTTTIHQLVKRTYSLELSGANVGTLGEGLFRRLILLRSLSLRNNNISQIKLGAFSGLGNLTALDLSENNIEEMHGGIFSELKTLLALAIRSVPVQYVRANAFAGLTHLQKLVLMRGNGTVSALSSSQYDWPIEFEDQALEDLTSLHTVYVDDHRLCCDFRSVLPSDDQCISIRFQSPLFNCGRLMPKTVLQVFMWILGCSALLGNMLVIVWRMREDSGKGSKYVHSFLVLNLAMSDFLMGVYMVIIATVDAIEKEKYYLTATQWRNSALCKAAGVISVLSSEASVFFITLISVDRYLCIVHPFSRVRLQETSVWVSVASIWLASLVVSLVPTILATSDSDIYGLSDVCIGLPLLTRPVDYTFTKDDVGGSLGNDTYLIPQPVGSRPTWSYSIVLFLGVNFMCFLVITVSYIAIFAKVKRSVRRVKLRSHKAEEIKMASKMAVIVGSDCLCWMPVIVLGILSQTSVIQIKPEAYAWLVVFVLPINSSLNPYLYTIVTAISQRRQAHQSTKKRSKGPEKTCSPDLPMEMRGDSGCWTITTPNATPTNSIYHGHPD